MKYFVAPTSVIEEGPGGKPLNVVLTKKEVAEEEFTKIIDDFFEEHLTEENKAAAEKNIKLAWDYLRKGKTVTIADKTLSIKK